MRCSATRRATDSALIHTVSACAQVKAFAVTKNSSAYWLGETTNDTLQRVYAVSFPEPKQLQTHLHNLEEAKKRDHRRLGEVRAQLAQPVLGSGR